MTKQASDNGQIEREKHESDEKIEREKRESDEKFQRARQNLAERHMEELAQEKLAQAILLAEMDGEVRQQQIIVRTELGIETPPRTPSPLANLLRSNNFFID